MVLQLHSLQSWQKVHQPSILFKRWQKCKAPGCFMTDQLKRHATHDTWQSAVDTHVGLKALISTLDSTRSAGLALVGPTS